MTRMTAVKNGGLIRNFVKSPSIYKNCGNFDTQAQKLFEREAEDGSKRLLEATNRLFSQWEDRHGFQRGAARILLPAGYSA